MLATIGWAHAVQLLVYIVFWLMVRQSLISKVVYGRFRHIPGDWRINMMSKHRIAILISLMLAMPAAVVAVEQAASGLAPVADAQPVAAESTAQPGERVGGTDGLVRAQPSDAFPKGHEVEWEIMPTLAQYLAEKERRQGVFVARDDSYPPGSDVEWQMPPVQVAYFARLERPQVANADPAPQARAEPAAAPASDSPNPLRKAADYITGVFKSNR